MRSRSTTLSKTKGNSYGKIIGILTLVIIASIIITGFYIKIVTQPKITHPVSMLADAPSTVRFSGILPCADCEGIQTELTLTYDQKHKPKSYQLRELYKGRSDTPFLTYGFWSIEEGASFDPHAIVYKLVGQTADDATYYLKQGRTLTLLTSQKEKMSTQLLMTLIQTK